MSYWRNAFDQYVSEDASRQVLLSKRSNYIVARGQFTRGKLASLRLNFQRRVKALYFRGMGRSPDLTAVSPVTKKCPSDQR